MKRWVFIFLILVIFPSVALAKVRVVSTLPIFASLANAIGGDRVAIKSLARPNQDPHFLPAKPSYAVALNRADLLIHAGLELEVGWLPAVLLQSRNSKIQFNAPGNVDAAAGIQVLELPTGMVDRSLGDIHPMGNPHYFLDPRNGVIIAENIYQHLLKVDPAGETYYQGRLQVFKNRLNQKLVSWGGSSQGLLGKKIVTYHRTFTYLASWLGIQVVANVESKPGIPPSSKHVDWLIKFIPENQVQGIFMAPYYPRKVPDYISHKIAIPVTVLSASTSGDGEEAYFQLFEDSLQKLRAVVK